jgi:MinD superfamily P-loop ATPase
VLACPADAIHERPRAIGRLRVGQSGEIKFLEGMLHVGEAMSPPAIRVVKSAAPPADLTILDAPPGTSCPVIETVRGCDRVVLVASLAALARPLVLVDCDVDAADLHLILEPRVVSREDFFGGSKARIRPGHCTACGKCEELCRFDAIYFDGPGNGRVSRTFRIDRLACEGCGVCLDYCAEKAIEFAPALAGQWFVSDTRCGPMVHAKLGVAAENSGKLVTQIRRAAQQVAEKHRLDMILHFGHCEQFAFVEVAENDGHAMQTTLVTPPPHEPGLLPRWLHEQGVTLVIAGGMGQRAQQLFVQSGIQVLVGAPAETPEALVSAFLNETLRCSGNTCDH